MKMHYFLQRALPLFSAGIVCLLAACASPAAEGAVSTVSIQPSATQFVFPPTFTAAPPGTFTPSPTPRATRTPSPTDTPAPTLAPTATPLFDVRQASAEDLPFVTASLVFASDGEIRLWDFLTLERRPLDEEAIPFPLEPVAISQGGYVVAGVQKSPDGFIISAYNRLSALETYREAIDADELLDVSISPDGSRLFITAVKFIEITPTVTPSSTPTQEGVEATPAASETPISEQTRPSGPAETYVFLARLSGSEPPVQVAKCDGACSQPAWSPFSDFVLWGDESGLWQMDVSSFNALRPLKVIEPFLVGVSGGGQQDDSYSPLEVSPSGRYVVVRKGLSDGSILALVDLSANAVENLPGTGEYTGSRTGFTWLFGDLLLLARPGVERLELLPAIEIWSFDFSQEQPFILFGRYIASNRYDVFPDNPAQLPDGRIAYTLNSYRDPGDPQANGLFILETASGISIQVNYLPIVQADFVRWLPDGSGVLIQTSSRLLYVPSGFGQIYSMNSFLGSRLCCFEWLP